MSLCTNVPIFLLRSSVTQRLGAIYLRWGSGEGQGLIVREKKIDLSEIGERGDRLRLRVKSVPLGYYLVKHFYPS